ncbi:MAG: hypothetical protein WCA38_15235 [Candidatus Acidiferrales bacterium]
MRPMRLAPSARYDLLLIHRLQSLPFYPEILRHLTMGESVRSLARWLVTQRIEGPASGWSARYWEKLLAPLDRQVRVAKERQMRADRRVAYHPPPPTPEQIETTLETITDTPMQMSNVLRSRTCDVWKHVDEVSEQITSERILKLAFVEVANRIDMLTETELQTHEREREMPLQIKNMREIADSLMKIEMLQGRFNLKPATPENAIDESDEAAHLRQFDEVDRNLIRSATMKVLNMIQGEASGKYEISGLGADAARDAGTVEAGSTEPSGTDVASGTDGV